MAIQDLKNLINRYIKANSREEITGPVLNNVLTQMVDGIHGAGLEGAVRYDANQTLTSSQMETARTNVGAVSSAEVTAAVNVEKNRAEAAEGELDERIDNLSSLGRFLSTWNCVTGKPYTDPTSTPYEYKTGDYFIVGNVGTTNYKPVGDEYTGAASTVVESNTVDVNDIYKFDGTSWGLLHLSGRVINWGGISGTLSNQTDLQNALNTKQDTISDLNTIRSGAASGATAYHKPGTGIPYNDLSAGVKSSLNKADNSSQVYYMWNEEWVGGEDLNPYDIESGLKNLGIGQSINLISDYYYDWDPETEEEIIVYEKQWGYPNIVNALVDDKCSVFLGTVEGWTTDPDDAPYIQYNKIITNFTEDWVPASGAWGGCYGYLINGYKVYRFEMKLEEDEEEGTFWSKGEITRLPDLESQGNKKTTLTSSNVDYPTCNAVKSEINTRLNNKSIEVVNSLPSSPSNTTLYFIPEQ